MQFVGIHVASGVAYYGVISRHPDTGTLHHVATAPDKLEPQPGKAAPGRLADTYGRINQDLRALTPCNVLIAGTRLHGNWAYRQAFERISLITIIMLACMDLGIDCEEMSTENIGKLVDLPAKGLGELNYEEVGFARKPKFWGVGRNVAFAAAKAAALSE